MKRIIITLLLLCSLANVFAQQAGRTITGTVRDASGPIPGVILFEKDVTNNGTTTNENGQFTMVPRGKAQVLVVKYIGYLQKEVSIAGKNNIAITIEQDVKGLEEVQIVGYGQTTKLSKTIASSSVTGDEIRRVPTASLQNALVGKLPGFFSMQRSGQPGADGAVFMIRGITTFSANRDVSPLIIVDDVEFTGNFSDIDAEQVASVTILKDAASASVYGIKGANGVIVVTTIRGASGKASVRLTSNTGWQQNSIRPHFLSAYDMARLRNDALESDGLPLEYTNEDLEAWRTGSDPFGHPDIDWWDVLIRKSALQTKNNLSINGGTDKMKYFVSIGHLWQNGILNSFQDPDSDVNPNYYLKRYNYRSNLDFQVTPTLDLSMDLAGYFTEQNEPNTRGRANRNKIWFEIFDYKALPPFAYPIRNPDGTYGAAPETVVTGGGAGNNIVARLEKGGYRRNYESDIQLNLRATQKLNFIARGLKLSGLLSYSSNQDFNRGLGRTNILSYIYNSKTDTYTPLLANNYRDEKYSLDADETTTKKRLNVQLNLSYDTTFNDRHHVYGLALLNQFNSSDGADIPEKFKGYTFRLGYDFKKKYLVELSGAYNGTDRFKSSERYGFFPAISGGWNIAEEPFFRNNVTFMDLFKIRGSIGMTGSDNLNNTYQYLYEHVYNTGANYNFGVSQKGYSGIIEGTLGNDDISWEKETQWNIGTDMNFFKNRLSFTAEYFHKRRTDIMMERGSLSNIIGIGLPPSNLGRIRNTGFEFNVDYKNRIGTFNYRINANMARAKNYIEFMDEGAPPYAWMKQTGGQADREKGYEFVGFYRDEADIDKSPLPVGARPKPGDIKYKDLNGDNKIDSYDQKYYDFANTPTNNYALTLAGDWKGFNFSFTFQSATNFRIGAFAEAVTPFFGNLRQVHLDAWRPDNQDASFPRISTMDNISNALSNKSDFWTVKGDYIKLRNAEIGYTLPREWVRKLRLQQVRLYANGSNLITWMLGPNLYDLDPEVTSNTEGGVYPNQKVYNLGLNVNF
ncbi:SusC/RagA family TonB-linked outer membrane protein [Chitinophaga barathri]|uniref:TonB-dependent receptor n=1 Tax=Chitinophaga barathri TaxID=1647451 RepID=A0A3N4MPE4_9BACT|nr:TonB-dependent receptor [Chitinophaga barathri]RPD41950.1 TonB-dependent receptor [Chitinophaga barathri]